MKLNYKNFIILFFVSLCPVVSQAQKRAPQPTQTLEDAKKLYMERKYDLAKPIFEKYTKTITTKGFDEAYPYLEEIYKKLYDLGDIIDLYEKQIQILEKKKEKTRIDSLQIILGQMERANKMLSKTENVQIIDSVIVDKADFLSRINLSKESGLITSGMDNSSASSIYTNERKDKRYYAKKSDKSVFQIYTESKLMNDWTDETKLPEPVNTTSDSNYPFVLSDGVTMYYASNENSIGGYDLFITRYNTTTKTYLNPEQLGMPFNSIYNDYLLAVDELNEVGYFASDRFQEPGKVIIYTFIPNPEKILLETEDKTILRNRARITSIKDTWKLGNNYATLLGKIKNQTASSGKEAKKDFTFVINDNIVYHTLSDFESDSAKDLFLKYQSLEKAYNSGEKKLEQDRLEYSKATGNKKDNLGKNIREEEARLEALYPHLQDAMIKVRNTEIRGLRQQQQ